MEGNRNSTRWLFPALIAAIIAWGTIVGVGAYLGGIRFGYDRSRGLVVAAAVLAFLSLWGILLYGRSGRVGRTK